MPIGPLPPSTPARTKPRRVRLSPQYTTRAALENMNNAHQFAEKIGRPLNTAFCINLRDWREHKGGWKAEESTPEHVDKLRIKLRVMLNGFCNDHNTPPAWCYVIENLKKGGVGHHIHYLLHLPEDRHEPLCKALGERIRKKIGWTKKKIAEMTKQKDEAPSPFEAKKVHLPYYFSKRDSSIGPHHFNKECSRLELDHYMTKGVNPDESFALRGVEYTFRDHAAVDDEGNSGGLPNRPNIQAQSANRPFRDAGSSLDISVKARKSRGWEEIKGLHFISREVSLKLSIETKFATVKKMISSKEIERMENALISMGDPNKCT